MGGKGVTKLVRMCASCPGAGGIDYLSRLVQCVVKWDRVESQTPGGVIGPASFPASKRINGGLGQRNLTLFLPLPITRALAPADQRHSNAAHRVQRVAGRCRIAPIGAGRGRLNPSLRLDRPGRHRRQGIRQCLGAFGCTDALAGILLSPAHTSGVGKALLGRQSTG